MVKQMFIKVISGVYHVNQTSFCINRTYNCEPKGEQCGPEGLSKRLMHQAMAHIFPI